MSTVDYSLEGRVALATLNRPPVNALSGEMAGDLDDALDRAEADGARALVLTGAPHFAAGADITGFQAAFDAGTPDALANRLSAVIRRLESLPLPTIAAVRGYALGGGLELAMGADFIYLAESAQVGQPEIKLGIIPGAGGTQRLARLVGFTLARDMVYSGRFVAADEARAAGLAAKVLPDDDLLPTALADAARWAAGPTKAIAAAKRAMNEGWGRPIDDALAVEAREFAGCFGTADAREGVAAFLGKRDPEFSGS